MDEMLILICAVIAIIASVVLFVFVINTVLPRTVIRRRYFLNERLGRGLKKYVSDGARAVVYEPMPSIRKYVKKYALIRCGGQKYLKCFVDERVKTLKYAIVMLDNRNRVIDVLSVDESPNNTRECGPIFLHRSTSYVALTVQEVNGRLLENANTSYYLLREVVLFALSVSVLSFLESLAVSLLVSVAAGAASGGWVNPVFNIGALVGTSVLIGALSVVILLLHCSKKDVRIRLND